MDLFKAIRRDARLEELSIRALAERHGVHKRTVRQALQAAAPPARKPRVFAAPKLDPAKPLIDVMLREDLIAHRKQQHTARRVLARLFDEHQMDGVSYASVRDYVARRRPQIQAEAGRTTEQAFVPQTHAPGEQAEYPRTSRTRRTAAPKFRRTSTVCVDWVATVQLQPVMPMS